MAGQELDLAGDLRREQVRLPVSAEAGKTRVGQARLASGGRRGDGQRGEPTTELPVGEVRQCRAARPGGGHREAALHDGTVEVHDIDEPTADVRRDGADAHPGECLAQAGLEGRDEATDRISLGHFLRAAGPGELGGQLDGQARMDRGRPDGQQHRHRVDVEDVDRTHYEVGSATQAGRRERCVDRARRQDRRHGQPVHGPARVGQDEEFRAAPRGRHGLLRQSIEGGLQPVRAGRRIPRGIQRPARGPSLAHGRQQTDEVRHDRPLQPNGPGRPRQPTQQRWPAPELHAQVHDHPLALRVDGRVGDLGERLTKMVGDRPVQAAAAGGRRVVAHAPERLVGLQGHRPDVEPGAFGIQAGEVAQHVGGRHGRGDDGVDAVLVDRPWRVMDGQRTERPGLRLGILEDRPPARIDEQ